METKFEVETAFGPVWMWGRDTGRPLVVVLTGAFAEFWVFDRLQLAMPDVDVVRLHHPGNHCPGLEPLHLGAIAAAYGSALETRFPGRRAAVLAMSAGALVALALRWPAVRRMVLVEPFLRTGHIWPFRRLGERVETETQRDFVRNVLGADGTRLEDRDYSHLLAALATPTRVLLGDTPLGAPRDISEMPSLVDDRDRAALGAHPLVSVTEAPGGHNVGSRHVDLIFAAISAAAREAAAA
jgi:hypothetical protein